MKQDKKSEKIIKKREKMFRQRWPRLQHLQLTYVMNKRGKYISVLKARLKKKFFVVKSEDFQLASSIRLGFEKLERALNKKKTVKQRRRVINLFEEAS